jgi:hypothetical protein
MKVPFPYFWTTTYLGFALFAVFLASFVGTK